MPHSLSSNPSWVIFDQRKYISAWFPLLELLLLTYSQKLVLLFGSTFSLCSLIPVSEVFLELGLEMAPDIWAFDPFRYILSTFIVMNGQVNYRLTCDLGFL